MCRLLVLLLCVAAALGSRDLKRDRFFDHMVRGARECADKGKPWLKCAGDELKKTAKATLDRMEAMLHEQSVRARELAGEAQDKCLKKYDKSDKASARSDCIHKVREFEMRRLRRYMLELSSISSIRATLECKKLKKKKDQKKCKKAVKKEQKRQHFLIRSNVRWGILRAHDYSVDDAIVDINVKKLLEDAQACTSYDCWRGVALRCPSDDLSRRRCVRALLRVPINTKDAANPFLKDIRSKLMCNCPKNSEEKKCRKKCVLRFRKYRNITARIFKGFCRFEALYETRLANASMKKCKGDEACLFKQKSKAAEGLYRSRRRILKLEYYTSMRRCRRFKKKKSAKKCEKIVQHIFTTNIYAARREAIDRAVHHAKVAISLARGVSGIVKKTTNKTTKGEQVSVVTSSGRETSAPASALELVGASDDLDSFVAVTTKSPATSVPSDCNFDELLNKIDELEGEVRDCLDDDNCVRSASTKLNNLTSELDQKKQQCKRTE